MKRCLVIVAMLFIAWSVKAQDVIKGSVVEEGTNQKLINVFVHNTTNKQITLVDKNGNFQIKGGLSQLIIFDSPGYVSDTLFVTEMKPLKITLKPMAIALREVQINATRKTFDPRIEYPEVYKKSKVYVLSPSTWFSKEGRDARRLKRFFANEERERYVDKYYTASYVATLVPLKGAELQNFMAIYRPSYEYVKNNNGPTLAMYINDAYKKYKNLPPEQRKLQDLNGK